MNRPNESRQCLSNTPGLVIQCNSQRLLFSVFFSSQFPPPSFLLYIEKDRICLPYFWGYSSEIPLHLHNNLPRSQVYKAKGLNLKEKFTEFVAYILKTCWIGARCEPCMVSRFWTVENSRIKVTQIQLKIAKYQTSEVTFKSSLAMNNNQRVFFFCVSVTLFYF